jgi:hypothetical protein
VEFHQKHWTVRNSAMITEGAMSIAEGNYGYRVDVNLVLDGGNKIRKNVLRTTLDMFRCMEIKIFKEFFTI